MAKEPVRDFYGKILGYIETNGNKQTARDFYGKILGTYDSSSNVTRDFYGKILGKGNLLSGLIFSKKK